MGLRRLLERLLSVRYCVTTSSTSPEQQQQQQSSSKGSRSSSCRYFCDAMAPCTRSRARARDREAELTTQDRSSIRVRRKRARKEESAALDPARNGDNEAHAGPEKLSECQICSASNQDDYFVTGCGHSFCRQCLKDHVEAVINSQMAVTETSFSDLLAQTTCATRGCMEELSRRDLVDILGPEQVEVYQRWLVSVSDKLYRPSLLSARIECANQMCTSQTTSSLILASNITEMTLAEVKHALEIRGIEKRCMKQSCMRELTKAVGVDDRDANKVTWLCKSCNSAWCAACGLQLPVILSKNDRSKVHTLKHCKGKQRYEIYKSLVELEEACKVYTQGRQSPLRKNSKSSAAGHTIWADGTGYGGDYIENKNHSENMQAQAKRVELELDGEVEKQLVFLTTVLRGDVVDGGKAPPLTVATCALMCWENVLSRLLRQLAANDSMLDISERSSLYLKMVSLLEAIQLHPELLPLLSRCPKQFVDLEHVTSSSSNGATKDDPQDSTMDKDNTVIQKLGNIYRQAKVMLQNMPQPEGNSGTNVDMSLARELCKCYESLQEGILKEEPPVVETNQQKLPQVVTTRSKSKKIESVSKDVERDLSMSHYKKILGDLQFRQLRMNDEKGEYKHYYKDHISGKVTNSTCIDKRGAHNHKRMMHLSKEIASLATTLPLEWESSIHLCVDENRVDVLRALIVGPQGTPYQNGLFFFDIFLPPDYPQVPPFVHFLTTGGGKVRFNPNLYDSGKICLSLLGTWSGPGWVPGKSTLLQVLVSIQSLIFVKDPYYNEPGFEQTKSPEAEKENGRHREHTLSLAVLGALRKPDPFFTEIVREHFRFKQSEVELQCDEWVAATPEGYARNRIANVARDVKTELKSLCA